jgi:ribosome maturation factor RimP
LSSLVETCIELGKPVIEEMGYILVNAEYVKEGKNFVLRYFVDSDHGVDIDECSVISEKISKLLDASDPIKEEYVLEISSPGAERVLKSKIEIKNAVNKYVNIRLYAPINNNKEYEGDLIAFEGDILTIRYKDNNKYRSIDIDYNKIAKIRLAIKF